MKSIHSIVVFVCLFSVDAFGRGDTIPGSRYSSGRAAAMGDAFLPLPDDGAAAMFYNPAAIPRLKGVHWEPVNFQLQTNWHAFEMLDYRTTPNLLSLNAYAPTLRESTYQGKFPGMGFSIAPSFYLKGISIGGLWQTRLMAKFENGNYTYRSQYQFIPSAGFGVRLAKGIIRLGYSAQWVHQAVGNVTVPQSTSELGYNQGLRQGSALSHNAGFAMTLPLRYLPALNIVARNLAGAKYNGFSLYPVAKDPVGVPETEPMSVDVSFSIQPKFTRAGWINLVGQLRDLTNTSGISIMGRAVLGAEFAFRGEFFLRGGFGSGWPAAGFGLRRPGGEFSLSYYSEEIGTKYHDIRDIRFILHYQLRPF